MCQFLIRPATCLIFVAIMFVAAHRKQNVAVEAAYRASTLSSEWRSIVGLSSGWLAGRLARSLARRPARWLSVGCPPTRCRTISHTGAALRFSQVAFSSLVFHWTRCQVGQMSPSLARSAPFSCRSATAERLLLLVWPAAERNSGCALEHTQARWYGPIAARPLVWSYCSGAGALWPIWPLATALLRSAQHTKGLN